MVATNMTSTDRPQLKLSRRAADIAIEVVSLGALAVTIGLVIFHWSRLPDRIPHHFDFAGKPDAWGGKWVLLFLPAISLVVYAVLTVVSRVPHRFNYIWQITPANAESQYRIALSMLAILKALVMTMFAYLTWATIRSVGGDTAGLGRLFLPTVLGSILLTVVVHILASHRAR